MKEIRIWLRYSKNSFQLILTHRFMMMVFFLGKGLRIFLFLIFLSFLFRGADNLAGYNRDQIIFFYLSFNLIDTLAQLFFREIYRFRQLVVSGGLDHVLAKPVNPLLRVLLGGTDFMDLVMLVLLATITFWFGWVNITRDIANWGLYILLVVNGLVIAAAFHIVVLGLGVMTTTVDHMVMIYRDFTSMLRIPVDLYIEPIRFLLTFAIPVGIMLTFPPKVLMGLLSPQMVILSLVFSGISIFMALKFWRYSLRQYQSASS